VSKDKEAGRLHIQCSSPGHLQRDSSRTLRRATWRYALVLDPDRHGRIRGSIVAMMQ
jgi:hypothetical protein